MKKGKKKKGEGNAGQAVDSRGPRTAYQKKGKKKKREAGEREKATKAPSSPRRRKKFLSKLKFSRKDRRTTRKKKGRTPHRHVAKKNR